MHELVLVLHVFCRLCWRTTLVLGTLIERIENGHIDITP